MQNRLNFPEVIGVLLEYKKKTYTQNQLIRDLFSSCIKTKASNADEAVEDNIKFSRWVNGEKPIPMDILNKYSASYGFEDMKCDIQELILPHMANISGAIEKLTVLIEDSTMVIGEEKAKELISEKDEATFIASVVMYSILNNHDNTSLLSPVLSDLLISNRLPSVADGFIGRKTDAKECNKKLAKSGILFIGGVAGIGKSEFAKYYANTNKDKYTNIIYIHYSGNLKRDITDMVFSTDKSEMTSDELFSSHYKILQELHSDSLVILDNFNVLPKEEPFFKEFRNNNFHLIITTRCNINVDDERKEELLTLDMEKDLLPLFLSNCPSARNEKDDVKDIIDAVHLHTLTVILSSLTLDATGLKASELLYELKTNGLSIPDSEVIDIYKDGDYAEGILIEHLKKLISLSKLSEDEKLIMRSMALMPSSGVLKRHFKDWLKLKSLENVTRLVKHGLIQDDKENRMFSLHPLIRDVVISELQPSISNCSTLFDSLHMICLVHGLEYNRPVNAINCQLSLMENIIIDDYPAYLLFLQDLFPHLEKYRYVEELPKLVDRIIMTMKDGRIDTSCDSALLQDYKAHIYIEKKDYDNAIKKQAKAIGIMEKCQNPNATKREMNLLSNPYSNIANTYLYMGKPETAADYIKKALEIRKMYSHLGLMESHDMLEQMMNLVELYIQNKDIRRAEELLSFYERIITDYIGTNTFDYARCQLKYGRIAMIKKQFPAAEKCLTTAEELITSIMGADSEYMMEVYAAKSTLNHYIGNDSIAKEYTNKYNNIAKQLDSNSPH